MGQRSPAYSGIIFGMTLSRRALLATSAVAAATALPKLLPAQAPTRRRFPIDVSTYTYWHFRAPKFPIEGIIDDAARLGFDGVEILHRQMTDESPSDVNGLN